MTLLSFVHLKNLGVSAGICPIPVAKPGRGSEVLLVAFASLLALRWVNPRQNLGRVMVVLSLATGCESRAEQTISLISNSFWWKPEINSPELALLQVS